MELEHTFTVPLAADEAFRILRDIERIGPCMPGATIESVDGDEFSGKVKVKVGPMQVTYQGTAAFVDVDEAARSATIEAKARETRGAGTANATIRARCTEQGEQTEVHVTTELAVTGKPAQFGRGVMADVGEKLLGQFADCLARELGEGHEPVLEDRAPDAAAAAAAGAGAGAGQDEGATGMAVPPGAGTAGSEEARRAAEAVPGEVGSPAVTAAAAQQPVQRRTDDTIDLIDLARGPVAKRVVPVAVLLALAGLLLWAVRRR